MVRFSDLGVFALLRQSTAPVADLNDQSPFCKHGQTAGFRGFEQYFGFSGVFNYFPEPLVDGL
jgi:hypothetical protein